MGGYLEIKEKPFVSNAISEILTINLPKSIRELSNSNPKYSFEGSAGKGRYAEVPWVRIFEKEISSSAQEEYYLVYLFDAQMQGFYLSFNQGVTQYNELYGSAAKSAMVKNTLKIRSKLGDIPSNFILKSIGLNSSSNLGKDYELCHICGKFYPLNGIPEDMVLIEDLNGMIKIYEQAKEFIGSSVLNLDESYTFEEREKIRSQNRKRSLGDIKELEILRSKKLRMEEGLEEDSSQEEYDQVCEGIKELEKTSVERD